MPLASLESNASSGFRKTHGARGIRRAEESQLDPDAILRTRARLLRWGRRNYRQFPWRDEQNPWLSFLAEFLLQRTQAGQVAAAYPDICERYPTAQSLVCAGVPGVRQLTATLGLHWRGELLLKIAENVAALRNCPPDDQAALISMKGIGDYTAAAWLSLHRETRAIIVDSNIARWLSRLSGFTRVSDLRRDRRLLHTCDLLTPTRAFKRYNYAVLDFTMTICRPRKPRCHRCPLKGDCVYAASESSLA